MQCKPKRVQLYRSQQSAAWLPGDCIPYQFLYESLSKYRIARSACATTFFPPGKFENCFSSTSGILSQIPRGPSENLIPLLRMLAYTLLPYHITHLLMCSQYKPAYKGHFRDVMSSTAAHCTQPSVTCFVDIPPRKGNEGNKEMLLGTLIR